MRLRYGRDQIGLRPIARPIAESRHRWASWPAPFGRCSVIKPSAAAATSICAVCSPAEPAGLGGCAPAIDTENRSNLTARTRSSRRASSENSNELALSRHARSVRRGLQIDGSMKLRERRGKPRSYVAQANKTARIAWAIMAKVRCIERLPLALEASAGRRSVGTAGFD